MPMPPEATWWRWARWGSGTPRSLRRSPPGCSGSTRRRWGLGAGADTEMLDRKVVTVAAALDRARRRYGADPGDPRVTLRALGGPELAVLAGVILGVASGGAVVVLDGLATSVAALVAVGLEPAVAAHLIAGQQSR